MQHHLPILQSKLTIPLASRTLERKRLIDPLKAISHKKLALVIAGAGCGKTTIVAQTVTRLAADTVWYSLDALDRDPAMFLGHLITGIQKHQPDFGVDLGVKLSLPLTSRKSRENLLLALLVEIENKITTPLVIVLDDYYLVQESREISDIIEFLLARRPTLVHVVIISRMVPDLKISRYRAMLEVIEMTQEDLSFRIDEIKSLYKCLFETRLSPSQIQTLHLKTGGWAAALLLFFNALKGKPGGSSHEDLFDIGRSEKLIFKYLEENIFDHQPPETQKFLMRSSLLSRLDPDFCNSLFKTENAQNILSDLCRQHLLTFPCGGGGNGYQYHHLLQAFLQNRLNRQYGRKRVDKLHFEIAKAMENKGDLQGAMDHFALGAHFDEVSRMLSGLVLLDFKDIPISFLKGLFDRIPIERIRQSARLLYVRAKVISVGGHIPQAIGEFKTALRQFRLEDDRFGAAGCLKDLGFHYYLTGDLERAAQEMKALWAFPHADPFFRVEVAGYIILFSAIMGDVEAADRYYHDAMDEFSSSDQIDSDFIRSWFGLCLGYRFHVAGEFRKADALNTRALDLFSKMQFDIFLPITCFQTALTSFYQAEPARGYELAQRGLDIAKKSGIFDNQYAWLLYALALSEFGRGTDEQALATAQASLDLFTAFDNAWGQALIHECRGMIYGHQGKWDRAYDAFNTGMRALAGLKQTRTPGQGALALGLAEAHMEKGRFGQARQTLEAYDTDIGISKFHLFRYHLLMAAIDAQKNNTDDAVRHLDTALTLSRTHAYHSWVAPHRPWLLPLLVECVHQKKHTDDVERLFAEADRKTHAALNLFKNKTSRHLRRTTERLLTRMPHTVPSPLNIRCLGHFSVSIGDRPIPTQQWRSAKATLIFKYMVVRHDQGMIPKETLLELAWPDEDIAVTRPRLHVALNALRKLLEPELTRGVPSAYIIRQNNAYRLEIGRQGRIDFKAFVQAANAATTNDEPDPDPALRRCVKAISLYGGALLKEDPYEEWVMPERERLKQKYLQVLSKIIGLYENRAAWHQCVEYTETYLRQDPYAEPVYRDLMRFHSNAGNPSGAMEAFQKCKRYINDDLDCPLSEPTLHLYQKLTRK